MKKIMTIVIAALLTIGLAFGSPVYAKSKSDADATAIVDQSGDSTTSRGIPGYIPNNPWPNPQYHNAPHTRTWNILQLVELAKIRRIWTRMQLEVLLSNAAGDTGDVTPIPYNAVPAVTKKSDRSPLDAIEMIFSTKVPEGYHDTGIIQVEEPDQDVNGLKMAAQFMLDAMNMGGNLLMVTIEDAEIKQTTKARSFFIGGGMSAIAGDGKGSGAYGGGGVSGSGAGSITSGKGLAPHATAVVLEANDDCFEVLDSGKVRCGTEEEVAAYQNAISKLNDVADLDEKGKGPKPTVSDVKDGNGKRMKEFYLETDQGK